MNHIINKIVRKILVVFIVFCISIIALSCNTKSAEKKVIIDFADTNYNNSKQDINVVEPVLIAVSPMISPRETFEYYNELLNYISKGIDRPVYFRQKRKYEEINEILYGGEFDLAFTSSGTYTDKSLKRKIKLLVVPMVNGKTYYREYLIVGKNSDVTGFEDLKDSVFAFTDPMSITGCIYPQHRIKTLAYNEKVYFSKVIYTYGQDISIRLVNTGIVSGASVSSLMFDYIASNYPERVNNIKIIEESEYFGIPPVVVPNSMDERKVRQYRSLFLNMHHDSIGKNILKKLNIEKFVIQEDTIYRNLSLLYNH